MERLESLALVRRVVLPSMAIRSCRPGQSSLIQLSKQLPNSRGSRRLINVQPAGPRDPKMKWREPSQKIPMMAACDDFIKIVAICDCCTGQKQHHFRQREGNPSRLPTILDLREMLERNGQA
jgi:hypothetical protein